MSYKVGQVLYILSSEKLRVVPVQIVEQTVRRTLDGEKVSYQIITPAKPDNPVSLENVKGRVCISLEQAQEELKRSAMNAIDGIIESARAMAVNAFSSQLDEDIVFESPADKSQDQKGDIVELPDGSVVKVNIPPELANELKQVQNL